MIEINDQALEELLHRGRWLSFPDFVRLIEQDHPHERPGVTEEVLEAYAAAIVDDLEVFAPFTVKQVDRLIERHLTRSTVWLESALYEVEPGRISVYPASWNERLHGETDPRTYVEIMRDELAAAKGFTTRGGAAPGVPKQQLLDAMVILGGMDRAEAIAALDEQRTQNELTIYPFQNPEAEVQLSEDIDTQLITGSRSCQRTDDEQREDADTERDKTEPEIGNKVMLPPLIDIRDDLGYLKEHTQEEVQESVHEIETTLGRLAEYGMSEQERFLDEIDNELLRIELEVSNDERTAQHVTNARNRIGIYRRALKDASDNLAVVDSAIRHVHTGHKATVAALQGTEAEIKAMVLNEGSSRNVVVIVTFYDSDQERLSKARSPRIDIASENERVVTIPVRVPMTAISYTVTALDIENYLTEYQFQQ